jgi:tRNA dimethylallyltransferase
MIDEGLIDEVKSLVAKGVKKGMTAMDGIGYKELLDYLDGNGSLEDAVELIKKKSRNYAKRQLTWFRREKEVIWLDKTVYASEDMLLYEILSTLREKGIIESV